MAYYKYTGTGSTLYPTLGITAVPGNTYDLNPDMTLPDANWLATSGPATAPSGGGAVLNSSQIPDLSGTYVRLSAGGSALAFFGDSITNFGEGYPFYAAGLSKGQFIAQQVASYPGLDSTALLPKITDVTTAAVLPSSCVILCGSNDATSANSVATFSANIISLVSSLRKAGIQPILATVPPRAGAAIAWVNKYNVWLRRYAALNNLLLIDFNSVLVDPSSGSYLAALSNGDNIHPNNAGCMAMAQAVVNALANYLPQDNYAVQGHVAGALDMSAAANNNSQFLANTAGVANGYSTSGGAAGTWSTVADARGFNWQQVVATGAVTWADASAGPVVAGDRWYMAMRFKTASSGQKVAVQVTFYDAAFVVNKGNTIINSPNSGTSQPFTEAIFVGEGVVPAGAAYAQVNVSVAGAGTYSWAQPTFYDLTMLGLSS